MPESVFNDTIHSPTRLRICAALDASRALEFGVLEKGLRISTSLLSKQLKVLSDAGYVTLDRRPQPVGRPRVWVSLTPEGRYAFKQHVAALQELLESPLD